MGEAQNIQKNYLLLIEEATLSEELVVHVKKSLKLQGLVVATKIQGIPQRF